MVATLISPRIFKLSWVLLVVLHVFIGLYMYGVARLHLFVRSHSNLVAHVGYLGDNLLSYFPAVIAISWVSVTAHSLMLLLIVWNSLRARALVLTRPETVSPKIGPTADAVSTVPATSRCFNIRGSVSRLTKRIAIKEIELELLVEIALQTFQANKLSYLIATVWINRLMVAVLVANCWFRPLVNRVLKKRQPFLVRQLICLAIDTLVDIVYGLVIPFVIFYPYWRDIQLPHYSFPFVFYYKDEWYIKAIAENQQLIVTSWVDFASKTTPALALAFRLRAVQQLLVKCASQPRDSAKDAALALADVVPVNNSSLYDSQVTIKLTKSGQRQRKVFHFILALWGLVVVALHLHATTVGLRGTERGCILELRPWTSTGYTCAVHEVSCSQRELYGHRSEMQEPLARILPSSLSVLVLSNCPELHVPDEIQRFPRLMMLKIYNSSIVDWPASAALTETTHPNMQLLYITRTNMASIPDGMRSLDFPSSLYDLEISDTNLTTLPDDVDEAWAGSLNYLFLELAPGVTGVPTAVARLRNLQVLSLSSDSIASIPDDLLGSLTFFQLALNFNPLHALPETIGRLDIASGIMIENTLVSELPPSWMHVESTAGWPVQGREAPVLVYARNSPLCEQIFTADPTLKGTLGPLVHVGGFSIYCDRRVQYPYYYPLDAEDKWRRVNQ